MDIKLILKKFSLVLFGGCISSFPVNAQDGQSLSQDGSSRPPILMVFMNNGIDGQYGISEVSSLFNQIEGEGSIVEDDSIEDVIVDESLTVTAEVIEPVMFPNEIYQELVQYTIGQDKAMYSLACSIHDHLVNTDLRKRQKQNPLDPDLIDLNLDKQNILMVGPTGCGKTSSLNVLSKFLKVPLVIGNATDWTCQGYIGGKWQDVFNNLLIVARESLRAEGKKVTAESLQEKVDHSIVFIDEIDKICSGGELGVVDRVQQELLPAIQGTVLNLEGGQLDTTKILFVAGGAFPGLLRSNADSSDDMPMITPHGLEQYGMLPELVGRLGNIVQFDHLKEADLKRIILESKNSILNQYIKKYKAAYKIDLSFEAAVINYIAKVAATYKTGARSLNAMLSALMRDKTFNIQQYIGKPLVITQKDAETALSSFKKKPRSEVKYPSMYS